MASYWVYILASKSGVLYIGMTNDLERRVSEHKQKLFPGFTAKYYVDRLVFYNEFPTADQAIATEKKLKGWTRAKKIGLVNERNPQWNDLAEQW